MELPQAGQSGKSGRRWVCVRWSRIIIRLDTRTAHRFAVTFVTGRRMVRSASITIERRVDFRLGQIVVNATGVPCAPSRGALSWPRCCAAPCRRFRICRGKCRGLRGRRPPVAAKRTANPRRAPCRRYGPGQAQIAAHVPRGEAPLRLRRYRHLLHARAALRLRSGRALPLKRRPNPHVALPATRGVVGRRFG